MELQQPVSSRLGYFIKPYLDQWYMALELQKLDGGSAEGACNQPKGSILGNVEGFDKSCQGLSL